MPYFKAQNGAVHFIERAEFIGLLPAGVVEITDAEALAASPAPNPKIVALSSIVALEQREMLPRVVREYLLSDFAAKALAAGKDPTMLPGYVKLRALDDQIAVLRAAAK